MTKKKNVIYDNESIDELEEIDKIRKLPGVVLGSDNIEGCKQTFFEILSNSIDEFKSGHGTEINVVRKKDNVLEVQDFGRGCPVDYSNKKKKYNWEMVFTKLFAGGKYNNDGTYHKQLGINGLGTAATQLSSEFFDVEVIRDGYQYNLHFEKGINIGGLTKTKLKNKNTPTGTKQTWKPDLDVFTENEIPLEYFLQVLKQQTIVNQGLTIHFYDEETELKKDFCCPDGLIGYIKEISGESSLTEPFLFEAVGRGKDTAKRGGKTITIREEYDVEFQFCFCFNNEVNNMEFYHNSSFLEYGGSPDKAIKKAFTDVLENQIMIKGKYQKNERKITFKDIQDSLVFISNSYSSKTSYENQTKKAIDNSFVQSFMTEKISENLTVWFLENRIEGDMIVDQILANKRSSESAERQRVATKKKLMGSINSMKNRVKKFVPCRSNDNTKTELFIVEGDSALGSVKLARDSEFQAIMPIRGKILNCLKATISKIMASEIIMDLIKVFGCGLEISGKNNKKNKLFNIDNLRWNKIIITTDADKDGDQIKCLVITMIYKLCPSLITNGFVYIVKTPLFEVTVYEKGKETTYFSFNDVEQQQLLKKLKNKKIRVQRSKGLGENTPEMMWDSTLNPETRHLIRITEEDAQIMEENFDLLLGNNLQGRKKYIEENGHLYLDDLDLD